MFYRLLLTVLMFASFYLCSSESKADFILATRIDGSSPTINASVGDTVSFDLFIVETNTSNISQQGLLSFGLRGTFSSITLQGLSVDISPQFPFIGGGADFSKPGQVDFFGGALNPPKATSVQLANMKFRVLGEGTTSIRFGDLDPNFDDFSLGDLTSLDSTMFGAAFDQTFSVSLQISAVPEPSSLMFVASASSFLLLRRRPNCRRSLKSL